MKKLILCYYTFECDDEEIEKFMTYWTQLFLNIKIGTGRIDLVDDLWLTTKNEISCVLMVDMIRRGKHISDRKQYEKHSR